MKLIKLFTKITNDWSGVFSLLSLTIFRERKKVSHISIKRNACIIWSWQTAGSVRCDVGISGVSWHPQWLHLGLPLACYRPCVIVWSSLSLQLCTHVLLCSFGQLRLTWYQSSCVYDSRV